MQIESGTGNGQWVGADIDHRLLVSAKTSPYQNVLSKEKGQAYQALGTATLANGTVTSLFLQNTSTTKYLILTYIRHQVIDNAGGTALPNANNYFRVASERSYASAGSRITPVNMKVGSGNNAEVLAYESNPTLSGSATEIDRWYTKAEGDMNVYNQEGAIVINPGKSIEFNYVGNQTSGIIFSRATFVMEDIEAV